MAGVALDMCSGKEDNGANAMSKRRGAEGTRFEGKPVAEIGQERNWGLRLRRRRLRRRRRQNSHPSSRARRAEVRQHFRRGRFRQVRMDMAHHPLAEFHGEFV